MRKLLLLPVMIAAACLLAGLYGMVHNQISYTVAPSYFHEFKFTQFAIAPDLQNRLGAAWVGWQASWWMGLIIGVPLGLTTLCIRGTSDTLRAFLIAATVVCAVTLAIGLAELWASFRVIGPNSLPHWMIGRNVSDPVGFARAGTMHNASYLGALVGLGGGMAFLLWRVWRSRRA